MYGSGLIESALEEAGTVVAVIAHPERGANAVIEHANRAFAAITRQTRPALEGLAVSALAPLVSDTEGWGALLASLQSGSPIELDLPIAAAGAESWLGLRLTFPPPREPGVRHAVLIGRDITAARKMATQEENTRRLLAAIFTRIAAPVVIVSNSGEITMANPAMYQLLGYSANELKGMRVDDLTPPEYTEAAQTARAKQLADGERYDMPFETFVKGSARVAVRLTSMLLRNGDQRLRVVTLIPDAPLAAAGSGEGPPAASTRDCGDLQAVSLAAFRAIFGDDWERIALRAMMRAEQIIRRRVGRDDVVTRSDGNSFVIWFSSTDREHNEEALDGIVREIRLRFLTEFGEQAGEHVSATLVPGNKAEIPGAAEPPAAPARQVLASGRAFRDPPAGAPPRQRRSR